VSRLACNLNAFATDERARYRELTERISAAARDRLELPDGYSFKLDGHALTLPETAEGISMERRCCPFFAFQLATSGDRDEWLLQLTGPEAAKAMIAGMFAELS
jgi:hypothetical protein